MDFSELGMAPALATEASLPRRALLLASRTVSEQLDDWPKMSVTTTATLALLESSALGMPSKMGI
jgi:hypothetical protein